MKTISHFSSFVLFVALVGVAFLLFASANSTPNTTNSPYSLLACGTDASGFSGLNGQLAVVHTNGFHVLGAVQLYNLDFPLNGITPAFGFVLSGQPEVVGSTQGNTLRALGDYPPPHVLVTISPGNNSFSPSCCDEQMVQAPDGSFYHAHYSDVIQRLSFQGKQSNVLQTYNQPSVVGMATDGVRIWISNWDSRQVGTWEPSTNTFTPIFSTPANAGGLAWDVTNRVLWVGMQGGSVIPYSPTGQQLGDGFQPFGDLGTNTVDGLAFVPGH